MPSHPTPHPVSRITASLLVILLSALGLTACTTPSDHSSTSTTVSSAGFTMKLPGVTATAGAGVAASGTRIQMQTITRHFAARPSRFLQPSGPVLRITLPGHKQPATPVTLTFTVDRKAETGNDQARSWGVIAQSADASTPFVLPATYNATKHTVTAITTHFTDLQAFSVKVGDLIHTVGSAVLKTMGVEFEQPDCDSSQAELDSVRYTVLRTPDVIPCVQVHDGHVQIDLQSITGQPLTATPHPRLTPYRSLTADKMDYLNQAIGTFTSGGSNGTILPGGSLTYRIDRPDQLSSITIEQNPGLLLAVVLEKTADTVFTDWSDFRGSHALDNLKCGKNLADATTRSTLNLDSATALTRSVIDCFGPVIAKGALPVRIVWALITVAPGLLTSLILGALKEVTGLHVQTVKLDTEQLITDVDRSRFASAADSVDGAGAFGFDSPSHNISCGIYLSDFQRVGPTWSCFIHDYSFTDPPAKPAGCDKEVGYGGLLKGNAWNEPDNPEAGIVTYPCYGGQEVPNQYGNQDPAHRNAVLSIGQRVTIQSIQCTLTATDGETMTCVDLNTKARFSVSSSRYRITQAPTLDLGEPSN